MTPLSSFDVVLGDRRGGGRAAVEPADVIEAFMSARTRPGCETLVSVAAGGGYAFLLGADGRLLARRRPGFDPAPHTVVSVHCGAPDWLRRTLRFTDALVEDFDPDAQGMVLRLCRFGAERAALRVIGISEDELLAPISTYLTAADWRTLAALQCAGAPVSTLQLRKHAPEAAEACVQTLDRFGLLDVTARLSCTLTADGEWALSHRFGEVRDRTQAPSGATTQLLADIAGLDLPGSVFRSLVGDGCALGPQATKALGDAGRGPELDRALLELHEILVAQSFSPAPRVLNVLRYAVLAVVGAGVLDRRDRTGLWNGYLNLTWQPLPG